MLITLARVVFTKEVPTVFVVAGFAESSSVEYFISQMRVKRPRQLVIGFEINASRAAPLTRVVVTLKDVFTPVNILRGTKNLVSLVRNTTFPIPVVCPANREVVFLRLLAALHGEGARLLLKFFAARAALTCRGVIDFVFPASAETGAGCIVT